MKHPTHSSYGISGVKTAGAAHSAIDYRGRADIGFTVGNEDASESVRLTANSNEGLATGAGEVLFMPRASLRKVHVVRGGSSDVQIGYVSSEIALGNAVENVEPPAYVPPSVPLTADSIEVTVDSDLITVDATII